MTTAVASRLPPRRHPCLVARWPLVTLVATLAACTAAPPKPAGPPQGTVAREASRWVPVDWHDLPGWKSDRALDAWPALLQSCQRPASAWTLLCSDVQRSPPDSDAELRDWLVRNVQPYRVESHRRSRRC